MNEPIYICENCSIEIPKIFYENPVTFGNVLAAITLGEDEQVSGIKSFRSIKGLLRHQDGICATLPREFPDHLLSSDPWEWKIYMHRKYYDPEPVEYEETTGFSPLVDKVVDSYQRSWE